MLVLTVIVTGGMGIYLFAMPLTNPLRRSSDQIAASLLEETSRGASRAEVEALVSRRGWRSGGIMGQEPPGGIGVEIGTYRDVLFRTAVFAYWVFDADDRLQEVKVNKMVIDAP
jgi:hypothetical protein